MISQEVEKRVKNVVIVPVAEETNAPNKTERSYEQWKAILLGEREAVVENDMKTSPILPLQSYIIQNRTLRTIHLLLEPSEEGFIRFLHDIYGKMEYEYTILPFTTEEPFTPAEWQDFCMYVRTHVGITFPMPSYQKETVDPTSLLAPLHDYEKAYRAHMAAKHRLHTCLFHPLGAIESKGKMTGMKKVVPIYASEVPALPALPAVYDISNAPDVPAVPAVPAVPDVSNVPVVPVVPVVPDVDTPSSFEYDEPTVASTYYKLEDDWAQVHTPRIILLLDQNQMTTLIIEGENCQWIEPLIKRLGGYVILKEYTNLLPLVKESLHSFFQLRQFVEEEDIRRKLESYEILHDLVSISMPVSTLEQKIYGYLSSTYEISGDAKKTMRASVLQKRIESALMGTEVGILSLMTDTVKFSKIVSGVLLNMGLKKKRMSDGIYYYGIEPRGAREKDMVTALEHLVRRNEQAPLTPYKK